MSTGLMTKPTAEVSPRLKARIAGVFYLLTFLTGGVVLFVGGRWSFVVDLMSTVFYIAVMALLCPK